MGTLFQMTNNSTCELSQLESSIAELNSMIVKLSLESQDRATKYSIKETHYSEHCEKGFHLHNQTRVNQLKENDPLIYEEINSKIEEPLSKYCNLTDLQLFPKLSETTELDCNIVLKEVFLKQELSLISEKSEQFLIFFASWNKQQVKVLKLIFDSVDSLVSQNQRIICIATDSSEESILKNLNNSLVESIDSKFNICKCSAMLMNLLSVSKTPYLLKFTTQDKKIVSFPQVSTFEQILDLLNNQSSNNELVLQDSINQKGLNDLYDLELAVEYLRKVKDRMAQVIYDYCYNFNFEATIDYSYSSKLVDDKLSRVISSQIIKVMISIRREHFFFKEEILQGLKNIGVPLNCIELDIIVMEQIEIESGINSLCESCRNLIDAGSWHYYCFTRKVYFCEACANISQPELSNNSPFKFKVKGNLIRLNKASTVEISRIGKNLAFIKEATLDDSWSRTFDAACNKCEKVITDTRWICLECLPGFIGTGGYNDLCSKCIFELESCPDKLMKFNENNKLNHTSQHCSLRLNYNLSNYFSY